MNFTPQRTLLIADDNSKVREFLGHYFETNGFVPLIAADGREALKLISKHSVDVALLDVNMPGLSGIDVLRQLRTDSPHTAVIMLTAAEDLGTVVEAMKLGAYDYVTKPSNLTDLQKRVQEALKQSALDVQREHLTKKYEETVQRQKEEL